MLKDIEKMDYFFERQRTLEVLTRTLGMLIKGDIKPLSMPIYYYR
jgi:hypothetical protein